MNGPSHAVDITVATKNMRSMAQQQQQQLLPMYSYGTPSSDELGQWIGNIWIPNYPWRLVAPTDLLKLFSGNNMFFAGDSTARRAAMTLYRIMNTTEEILCSTHQGAGISTYNGTNTIAISDFALEEPELINIGFGRKSKYKSVCRGSATPTTFCNYTPSSSTCVMNEKTKGLEENSRPKFAVAKLSCLDHVRDFLERMEKFDQLIAWQTGDYRQGIVVFSLGIWDVLDVKACKKTSFDGNSEDHLLESTLEALSAYAKNNSHLDFYWRTPLYKQGTPESPWNVRVSRMRDFIINWFAREQQNRPLPNLDVIDVGGAIYSRSFGEYRIEGDSPQHYGAQARLVFIQMLANKINDKQMRRHQALIKG